MFGPETGEKETQTSNLVGVKNLNVLKSFDGFADAARDVGVVAIFDQGAVNMEVALWRVLRSKKELFTVEGSTTTMPELITTKMHSSSFVPLMNLT